MTNSAAQLRTTASTTRGLLFATLILPLGISSVPAFAGANIQMLPPVTEASKLSPNPDPCPPGGSPNILTWDGTNPISCTTGVVVTGGNVGIGTTSPNANLQVLGTGTQASPSTITISAPNGTTAGDAQLVLGQTPTGHDFRLLMAGTDSRTDGLEGNDVYGISAQALDLTAEGNGSTINTMIKIGDGTNPNYGAIGFYTAAVNAAAFERMVIDQSGNVGIGTASPQSTLDVNGNVRVGDSGVGCFAANEGSQRYNRTTQKMEFCNGTTWDTFLVPTITVKSAVYSFGSVAKYLDCPSRTTAIACNDVVIPSGAYSCQITPGVTDPDTQLSSCAYAGCGNHDRGDTGYYATATCLGF